MHSHVEPRRVPLDNVFNLRELGGYPTIDGGRVRAGQLFRADGLNRLSDADARVVGALGIRTVVDLRTLGERDQWGAAPVHLFDATAMHLPLISELWPTFEETDEHDPVAYLIERYHEMTVDGAESLATLLQMLAHEPESSPLVFHCSAGKDRTGVTAALLLGLLGVPDAQIVADYAHSAVAMDDLVAWVRANSTAASSDTMADHPKAFLACPPEAMAGFLAELRDRFGSVDGYANSIGIDEATLKELRAAYVDS